MSDQPPQAESPERRDPGIDHGSGGAPPDRPSLTPGPEDRSTGATRETMPNAAGKREEPGGAGRTEKSAGSGRPELSSPSALRGLLKYGGDIAAATRRAGKGLLDVVGLGTTRSSTRAPDVIPDGGPDQAMDGGPDGMPPDGRLPEAVPVGGTPDAGPAEEPISEETSLTPAGQHAPMSVDSSIAGTHGPMTGVAEGSEGEGLSPPLPEAQENEVGGISEPGPRDSEGFFPQGKEKDEGMRPPPVERGEDGKLYDERLDPVSGRVFEHDLNGTLYISLYQDGQVLRREPYTGTRRELRRDGVIEIVSYEEGWPVGRAEWTESGLRPSPVGNALIGGIAGIAKSAGQHAAKEIVEAFIAEGVIHGAEHGPQEIAEGVETVWDAISVERGEQNQSIPEEELMSIDESLESEHVPEPPAAQEGVSESSH